MRGFLFPFRSFCILLYLHFNSIFSPLDITKEAVVSCVSRRHKKARWMDRNAGRQGSGREEEEEAG